MNERTEFGLSAIENLRGWSPEHGISIKVAYKWRERFVPWGLNGLGHASRRPRSSLRGLAEGVVCENVPEEAHRAWGAAQDPGVA